MKGSHPCILNKYLNAKINLCSKLISSNKANKVNQKTGIQIFSFILKCIDCAHLNLFFSDKEI